MHKLVNGVRVELTKNEEDALLAEWNDTSSQTKLRNSQINRIAAEKILNMAPLYQQNNLLAASIEALKKGDKTTLDKMQVVWDRINAVRTYSNQLQIDSAANPAMDVTQGWPE